MTKDSVRHPEISFIILALFLRATPSTVPQKDLGGVAAEHFVDS